MVPIEEFYKQDSATPIRFATKLTKKHFTLPPFANLSVKIATQVLSHTVAAAISAMVKHDKSLYPKKHLLQQGLLITLINFSTPSKVEIYTVAIQKEMQFLLLVKKSLFCKRCSSGLKPSGAKRRRENCHV
ncbi:hypothetical protein PoB_002465300 [Plakobranchus ocellatus]|uniref:Uncharacterized protein n=1 Tax=Plakobranchus ocellatus TaxID=259542 RepID=A0AAV3ZTH1_9GAST|nr:hypothetical protein PoB_002465300 [Plakobranchus ocellatus]